MTSRDILKRGDYVTLLSKPSLRNAHLPLTVGRVYQIVDFDELGNLITTTDEEGSTASYSRHRVEKKLDKKQTA